MFAVVDPALVTLAGIALTAGGAYYAAFRQFRGSISTSTATDLWAESKAIRDDYKARIADQNAEIAAQRARISGLVDEVTSLKRRVDEVGAHSHDLDDLISKQRSEIADLQEQLRVCKESATVTKEKVDELQRKLDHEREKVGELERRAN